MSAAYTTVSLALMLSQSVRTTVGLRTVRTNCRADIIVAHGVRFSACGLHRAIMLCMSNDIASRS